MGRRQSPARAASRHDEIEKRLPKLFPMGEYLEQKDQIARRGEVLCMLQWYHHNMIVQNRWWRRLWRALRGIQPVTFQPMQLYALYLSQKYPRNPDAPVD